MSLCSSGESNLSSVCPYPIASLVPQSRRMVLVDHVLEVSDDHIVVELTVRDDGLFSQADHTVPAWLGLEYMAQTVAAFSGYHRRRAGEAVGLGFLLGTRHFQASVGSFPCGARLTVRADKVIEAANDMSVFDCRLQGDAISAESKLNVLLPKDSQQFLAGKGL